MTITLLHLFIFVFSLILAFLILILRTLNSLEDRLAEYLLSKGSRTIKEEYWNIVVRLDKIIEKLDKNKESNGTE